MSGSAEPPLPGQVPVIGRKLRAPPNCRFPVALYFLLKAAPWAVYLWPHAPHCLTLATFLFLAVADVWLTDRVFGGFLAGALADDRDGARSALWVGLVANAVAAACVALANLARLRFAASAVVAAAALLQWAHVAHCVRDARPGPL